MKLAVVLSLSLLVVPVCLAQTPLLKQVKVYSSEIASHLKRAVLRSSVTEKIVAVAAIALLSANAYGGEVKANNASPLAATEEVASQATQTRYDFLSFYFGGGGNYLPESTGAYKINIEGTEYQRLGDYYDGIPTTIDETVDSLLVWGLGKGLRDTGIEVKCLFFFGGTNRVMSGVYYPDPNNEKMFKGKGNMPNIIFAATQQLFGFNGRKGFVGLRGDAPLTFHLGPSFNVHPVYGTVTKYEPAKISKYALTNAAGDTKYWERKVNDQYREERIVGVSGHLGFGLVWQTNLDLANIYWDDLEGGFGFGLSYIGSVTHRGSFTHLVTIRFSLQGE